jgi:hypothetical protein
VRPSQPLASVRIREHVALLFLQITDTAKARTFMHHSPVTRARTQLAEASEFKATGALGGTKRLANDGVGLLFMSYQSSIQDPFRFMPSTWVNNPGFPEGGAGVDR